MPEEQKIVALHAAALALYREARNCLGLALAHLAQHHSSMDPLPTREHLHFAGYVGGIYIILEPDEFWLTAQLPPGNPAHLKTPCALAHDGIRGMIMALRTVIRKAPVTQCPPHVVGYLTESKGKLEESKAMLKQVLDLLESQ